MKKVLSALVALNVFSSISFLSCGAISCAGEACDKVVAKGDENEPKDSGKSCEKKGENFKGANSEKLSALKENLDNVRKDLDAVRLNLNTHVNKDYHGEVLKKGGWFKSIVGYALAASVCTLSVEAIQKVWKEYIWPPLRDYMLRP